MAAENEKRADGGKGVRLEWVKVLAVTVLCLAGAAALYAAYAVWGAVPAPVPAPVPVAPATVCG